MESVTSLQGVVDYTNPNSFIQHETLVLQAQEDRWFRGLVLKSRFY